MIHRQVMRGALRYKGRWTNSFASLGISSKRNEAVPSSATLQSTMSPVSGMRFELRDGIVGDEGSTVAFQKCLHHASSPIGCLPPSKNEDGSV